MWYNKILLHSFLSLENMTPQLTCSHCQCLHSSVGRASHRYREIMGSNPVEVLIFFFQASLRNCINCVHCDDHFFIFKTIINQNCDQTRQPDMYIQCIALLYIFKHINQRKKRCICVTFPAEEEDKGQTFRGRGFFRAA